MATSNQESAILSIDSNSPLYVHPSNTPGSVLVSEQLMGTENYGVWSRAMTVSLCAKNKLGFVNGTCTKTSVHSRSVPQWDRCNSLVLAWIFNSVSKEIFNGVVYSTDISQVWQDLKEQFHKVNGTRIFGLHREIVNLTQGTSTVAVYYNKLKSLWDELDSLVSLPAPESVSTKAFLEHLNQQKLLQFLMGFSTLR